MKSGLAREKVSIVVFTSGYSTSFSLRWGWESVENKLLQWIENKKKNLSSKLRLGN